MRVINKHITIKEKIQIYFFDMLDINGYIALRQLQFTGKKIMRDPDHPVKQLMIACIDEPQPRGLPPIQGRKKVKLRN